MTLKEFLKKKKIPLQRLSDMADVPYTNVYELANGLVDIDRCRFGAVKRIAEACDVTLGELYTMCKEETSLPEIKGGTLLIKNKKYYLRTGEGENVKETELCRDNKDNRQFIRFIAESELEMMERQKEIEEIENWRASDTT